MTGGGAGERRRKGITGDRVGNPVTTVQVCVTTFFSMTLLDTLGQFPAVLVAPKNRYFGREVGTSAARFVATIPGVIWQA